MPLFLFKLELVGMVALLGVGCAAEETSQEEGKAKLGYSQEACLDKAGCQERAAEAFAMTLGALVEAHPIRAKIGNVHLSVLLTSPGPNLIVSNSNELLPGDPKEGPAIDDAGQVATLGAESGKALHQALHETWLGSLSSAPATGGATADRPYRFVGYVNDLHAKDAEAQTVSYATGCQFYALDQIPQDWFTQLDDHLGYRSYYNFRLAGSSKDGYRQRIIVDLPHVDCRFVFESAKVLPEKVQFYVAPEEPFADAHAIGDIVALKDLSATPHGAVTQGWLKELLGAKQIPKDALDVQQQWDAHLAGVGWRALGRSVGVLSFFVGFLQLPKALALLGGSAAAASKVRTTASLGALAWGMFRVTTELAALGSDAAQAVGAETLIAKIPDANARALSLFTLRGLDLLAIASLSGLLDGTSFSKAARSASGFLQEGMLADNLRLLKESKVPANEIEKLRVTFQKVLENSKQQLQKIKPADLLVCKT